MKEVNFLKLDSTIQKILGISCVVFLPLYYLGLMLLLPFGIWQVISGIVMVYIFKDQKRIPYLIFNVIWFSIYLLFKDASWVSSELGFAYIILLPACVGVWYFIVTQKHYKEVKAKEVADVRSEYV